MSFRLNLNLFRKMRGFALVEIAVLTALTSIIGTWSYQGFYHHIAEYRTRQFLNHIESSKVLTTSTESIPSLEKYILEQKGGKVLYFVSIEDTRGVHASKVRVDISHEIDFLMRGHKEGRLSSPAFRHMSVDSFISQTNITGSNAFESIMHESQ